MDLFGSWIGQECVVGTGLSHLSRKQLYASYQRWCDESGVKSETVISTGHPVEIIVKEAKKSKADLIVMGSHGRSALSAAVLGSVAYGVIHNETKVPVLIVRRG